MNARKRRFLILALLAAAVLRWAYGSFHTAVPGLIRMRLKTFYESPALAVGGLGVVEKGVYVDLDSPNNELIIKGREGGWVGLSRRQHQVIFLHDGQIAPEGLMPEGFPVEQSIAISFEANHVIILNNGSGQGWFYRRE